MKPVLFSTFVQNCLYFNKRLQRLQHIYKNSPEICEWWNTRLKTPLSNAVSQLRHVLTNAHSRNCSGDRGFIGVLRRRISSIRFLSLSRCSKNFSIVSGPVYTNISWLLNSGNADTVKHDTPEGTCFFVFLESLSFGMTNVSKSAYMLNGISRKLPKFLNFITFSPGVGYTTFWAGCWLHISSWATSVCSWLKE